MPYRGKESPVIELAKYRQAHTDEEIINHYKRLEPC